MNSGPGDLALHAPVLDNSTQEGPSNRAKLLRAWIELSAWLACFTKRNGLSLLTSFSVVVIFSLPPLAAELVEHLRIRTSVKIDSVRELYQTAIGAHPEQCQCFEIGSGEITDQCSSAPWGSPGYLERDERTSRRLENARTDPFVVHPRYHLLPVALVCPDRFGIELLNFAYLAQCRCDPGETIRYFTALVNIVQAMQIMNEDTPIDLQNLLLDERTRGRFTRDDFLKAVAALGFGHDGPLRVDFDESVEEEFIINAWRHGIRRSWKDETNGSATRRELNDAMRIIAEVRGSAEMHHVWEREKGSVMTVDTAYSTLGVSKEMDENTLITVFDMRVSDISCRRFRLPILPKVEDQASQVDKLREALSVIAQVTESQRLKVFLDTGRDRESKTAPSLPCVPIESFSWRCCRTHSSRHAPRTTSAREHLLS